jgi:hypothetical protein
VIASKHPARWAAGKGRERDNEWEFREKRRQAEVLRCLFHPFLAGPTQGASLLTRGGLIPRLAQAAYDDRLPEGTLDPARLAVLSDAIEELGLADATLLEHLRGPGPHWRGCWGVEGLLGRGF